jgi:hypothetical protein
MLGSRLAVLQWEEGRFFRLYLQRDADTILEWGSDDNGKKWSAGGWQPSFI